MDRLANVLARLPEFYNKEDSSSITYNIIKSFVDEFIVVTSDITRMSNMIGVNTTNAIDLEYRWGNLLLLPRKDNETDDEYRNRLKLSVTTLSGGTASALQYAIAVGLGTNSDADAIAKIKIYDAWDYPGTGVPTDYGNIVCLIDMDNIQFRSDIEDIIIQCANSVKASGTFITLVFTNYRMYTYTELDNITYASLNNIEYNKIGE